MRRGPIITPPSSQLLSAVESLYREGRVGALSSLLGLARESQGVEDSIMAADTLPVGEISEEVVISDPYWVVGRRGRRIVESRREKTDSGYNGTDSSRKDMTGKSQEMDIDDTDDFITDFSRHLLDSTRNLQSTQRRKGKVVTRNLPSTKGDPARRQGVTLWESCRNISLVPGQRRKGKVDKSSSSKTSSKDRILVTGIREDVMSQAVGREGRSQGGGREGRVEGEGREGRSNGAVREGRGSGEAGVGTGLGESREGRIQGAGREERSQGAGREERRIQCAEQKGRSQGAGIGRKNQGADIGRKSQGAGIGTKKQGAGRSRAGFGLGDCLTLEETSSPEKLEVRRRLPKVRVDLTA